MAQLYILDDDNNARPVTWGEYDIWEERLAKHERCALGKMLRKDFAGGVAVYTVFLMTCIGYFGRKPQLWLTTTVGDGIFHERRYSSHRAAIQGHLAACREQGIRSVDVALPSVAPEQEQPQDAAT